MSGHHRSIRFVLCGTLLGLCPAVAQRAFGEASLCLSVQQACELPGTPVTLAVVVDPTSSACYGGQFTIRYDKTKLDFVEIAPGSSCDSGSLFAVPLYQSVNESAGEVFYAVGVATGSEPVAGVPCTIACLTMIPRDLGATEVCVLEHSSPAATLLADGAGEPIAIVNDESCPPDGSPNVLTCTQIEVTESCTCTPGGGECAPLDAPCRDAFCDVTRDVCAIQPVNEGGPCDDGNACTMADVCVDGQCQGSGCTDPSLCIVQQGCIGAGQLMLVAVTLGETPHDVVGGQFSIKYDPEGLEFLSMIPGAQCDAESPFGIENGMAIDSGKGTISYAVGAFPNADPPSGPTPMACAYFRVLDYSRTDVCGLSGATPFTTRLVNAQGQTVNIYNVEACPANKPYPYTSCVSYQFCRIPAASEWGLVILFLAVAILSKVYLSMPRRA